MLLKFHYSDNNYLTHETDEILIDGETIEQRDARIRQEFINKLADELSSMHSDDNSWCEYDADEFIDEMVDVAEKIK